MRVSRPLIAILSLILTGVIYAVVTHVNFDPQHRVGDAIDSFNGVTVYFNGGINTNSGRNLAPDGYNLGIKYQCVEFVKRYYYVHLGHRMPNSFGNAKDLFDGSIADGGFNTGRALLQFKNGGWTKPAADDVIVFDGWLLNPYGHVGIISAVSDDAIEIVQQNSGPFEGSRARLSLVTREGHWYVRSSRILGWLRKS